MNNFINEENKNLISSVFYLIYVIIKEKWLLLIGIALFWLALWMPFSIWWGKEDGSSVGSYILSLNVILPIILISFIVIPIMHQQIFSSSIKMRLDAAGISFRVFSIALIILFSVFLIILFYILLILFAIFFNEVRKYEQMWDGTYAWVVKFNPSFGVVELIFLPVICITGIVSIGVLISLLRVNEILKGIIIFILLLLTIAISVGSTTLMSNTGNLYGDNNAEVVAKQLHWFRMFLINPFSTITYTLQTTINSDSLVVFGSGGQAINGVLVEFMNTTIDKEIIIQQFFGCLYSFAFISLAILFS